VFKPLISGIAIAVFLFVAAYVGCSTKSTLPPPPQPPTFAPSMQPSPQSKSLTVAITTGSPTPLPIPAIGGFSGTFEVANNNAPAGTTVRLTSYAKAPNTAPVTLAFARIRSRWAAQAHKLSTSPTAIFWVSQQYSAAVSFQAFPITAWQVPASDASGPLALETFDGTTNTLMDTEFDTSISGNIATFPGSSGTFAVVLGHTYWWELITGEPVPSPSPSVSPLPSPSPSVAPLQITSGTPPAGEVGKPYGSFHSVCTCFCKKGGCRRNWTGYALDASGGVSPYTASWSPAAGSSLPPVLSVVPEPFQAGAIVGTPTTVGTYRVIVTITDSETPARHIRALYSIIVYPGPTPLAATEYPIPTSNSGADDITAGPDGNVWFTESPAGKVAKVTTNGVFSEYVIPQRSGITSNTVIDIHTGPNNNLWFINGVTGGANVDQIVPASGAITQSNLGTSHNFRGLAFGRDGNVWLTDAQSSARIDVLTLGGVITHQYQVNSSPVTLGHIVVGSDGNLWFVDVDDNSIGKITTAGVITEYPVPTASSGLSTILTLGPDGNVWFAENGANKVGKITTAGVITEFSLPGNSGPLGLSAGPDGNVWFTENNASQIGRITPAGSIKEFTIPTAGSGPVGIAPGPDGDLWFTESNANKVAKFKP
jgi:streptogramin lyase